MKWREGNRLWAAIILSFFLAGFSGAQVTNIWTGERALSFGEYNTNQDSTHLAGNWLGAGTADNDTGHYVFNSANLLEPWRTRVRESRDNITRLSMLFAMDEPVFNDPTDGGDGWVSGFTIVNNAFNLAGPVTVNSGQHTINNEMTLLANTQWTVADGARIETDSPISGDFGITKTGDGVLFLDAANTFTNGVTVNAGTVEFVHDNRFGASTGTVTLNGGGLSYTHTADRSSARPFLIGPAGGTVHVSESVGRYAFAAGGSLSGEGDLTKTGPGTFYINAVDDRTSGNLIVEQGTLEFSFANRIRENSTVTLHDGTTLENSLGIEGELPFTNRSIVLDDGTVILKNSGVREVAVGDISGEGTLRVEVTDIGSFELVGNNTYSGGTVHASGLLIGNAAHAFGTGGMTVADGAELILRASDTIADDAALVLGSSAILELDFEGAETVGTLSLDGGATWVDPGTYDATDLSGMGDGTYLGTGSITVSSLPIVFSTVEAWVEAGNLILSWDAEPGHTWSIWSTTNLLDGFELLEAGLTSGSYTNLMEEPVRFFRVSQE